MFFKSLKGFPFVVLLALIANPMVQAGVVLESALTFEKVSQSGEIYRGKLLLRNTEDTPGEAKLYQTDYEFSVNENIRYGEPGRLARSNANWIRLSRNQVTVPGNSTEVIEFEVKVPSGQGSALNGTYWSMIMVEPIDQRSAESMSDLEDGSVQIKQVMRYAVQVVTHIGNTGSTGLSFTNPGLTTEGNEHIFAIDVENTGQRWVRPNLWLELYNESGKPIGKFEGPGKRLYPSTSARIKVQLGDVPTGKYLGLVVADGTGDDLFGANVELDIE
ncbi:hypothetical protein [Thiocapsa sp.]|uniref:hypothetical protein n=1 Tax=Thiocapsa sp. TaxID=2024551 RepID=UPI003593CD79